ncbi:MAG: molybdenum cofactor guanylyltransferase [Acidobacteriota bacterium]
MIDATGFITAGGRSSRMGTDKAWLELGGRAMIEHVIAALVPVTTSVAIIANGPEYARLGFPVFADEQTGIGPLEAIRTALASSNTSCIVLAGCDLPFVTAELFRFLLSIPGDHQAVVPIGADGKLEPLCAIYRSGALLVVTSLIAQGERKISLLFDRLPTRVVAFEELRHLEGSELFFENVNTPEDYARASERLGPRTTRIPK